MIKSLIYQNEKDDKHEGKVVTQILKLNGKKPIYFYIRTRSELILLNPALMKTRKK